MNEKKIPKNFKFSEKSVILLNKIAEFESRTLTGALEKMIEEKAQYYGLKYFKKIPQYEGSFDHVDKENPFKKMNGEEK